MKLKIASLFSNSSNVTNFLPLLFLTLHGRAFPYGFRILLASATTFIGLGDTGVFKRYLADRKFDRFLANRH